MPDELREFKRLVPKSNAFAALGRGITMVGKINDISKGGLAFEHITNLDLHQGDPNIIDIFLAGSEFYLSDIPCTRVYDMPIDTGNVFSSPFTTKRCGVKFSFLNDAQLEQLEIFLKNHTIG